jgi:hypothetical protein
MQLPAHWLPLASLGMHIAAVPWLSMWYAFDPVLCFWEQFIFCKQHLSCSAMLCCGYTCCIILHASPQHLKSCPCQWQWFATIPDRKGQKQYFNDVVPTPYCVISAVDISCRWHGWRALCAEASQLAALHVWHSSVQAGADLWAALPCVAQAFIQLVATASLSRIRWDGVVDV